jgi:guanylate kinase
MRLRGDSEADIKHRMADFDRHMTEAQYYDHIIENINLQETIDKILEIIYNSKYGKRN